MGHLQRQFCKPSGWQEGKFSTEHHADLHYGQLQQHASPLAHVVYVEGLSEFTEKTFELAKDFNEASCNFSVFDRHGQGASKRYLKDREKIHSGPIEHDVDDLIHFCEQKVKQGQPIILFAHSTGALIALQALKKRPELFKGAIITAPLLGLKDPIIHNKEKLFSYIPLPSFIKKKYVFGEGPWEPRTVRKDQLFSTDPVRKHVHDYWQKHRKELRVGGPTFGWLKEITKAISKTRTPDFLRGIKHPLLIATAGDDQMVENKHTSKAMQSLPNATHIHYEDAKHELVMEQDHIRKPLIKSAISHIKNCL